MEIEIGKSKDAIFIGQRHDSEIFEVSSEQVIIISKNTDDIDNPIIGILSTDNNYVLNTTLSMLEDIIKHTKINNSALNEKLDN